MSRSSRTDAEVLFLGLEGSGKTLLARRLQSLLGEASSARGKRSGGLREPPEISTEVVPTIGVDVATVKHKRRNLRLREVGGAMRPLWPTYLSSCSALLVSFTREARDVIRIATRSTHR